MKSDEADARLERLIEEALAVYTNAEPLAGMEERVLQRVRAEGGRPRRKWLGGAGWAAISVSAAAALWAAAIWTHPVAAPARVLLNAPRATPLFAAVHPVVPRRAPVLRPKPAVTAEERALLALVAQAPEETSAALRELQLKASEPVRVDEIKIEPLQVDGSR